MSRQLKISGLFAAEPRLRRAAECAYSGSYTLADDHADPSVNYAETDEFSPAKRARHSPDNDNGSNQLGDDSEQAGDSSHGDDYGGLFRQVLSNNPMSRKVFCLKGGKPIQQFPGNGMLVLPSELPDEFTGSYAEAIEMCRRMVEVWKTVTFDYDTVDDVKASNFGNILYGKRRSFRKTNYENVHSQDIRWFYHETGVTGSTVPTRKNPRKQKDRDDIEYHCMTQYDGQSRKLAAKYVHRLVLDAFYPLEQANVDLADRLRGGATRLVACHNTVIPGVTSRSCRLDHLRWDSQIANLAEGGGVLNRRTGLHRGLYKAGGKVESRYGPRYVYGVRDSLVAPIPAELKQLLRWQKGTTREFLLFEQERDTGKRDCLRTHGQYAKRRAFRFAAIMEKKLGRLSEDCSQSTWDAPDPNDPETCSLNDDDFLKFCTELVPDMHKFDDRFAELVQFKAKHGHTMVPQRYEPNQRLANWVSTLIGGEQTDSYRNPKTAVKIALKRKLESIGFEWTRRKP